MCVPLEPPKVVEHQQKLNDFLKDECTTAPPKRLRTFYLFGETVFLADRGHITSPTISMTNENITIRLDCGDIDISIQVIEHLHALHKRHFSHSPSIILQHASS